MMMIDDDDDGEIHEETQGGTQRETETDREAHTENEYVMLLALAMEDRARAQNVGSLWNLGKAGEQIFL